MDRKRNTERDRDIERGRQRSGGVVSWSLGEGVWKQIGHKEEGRRVHQRNGESNYSYLRSWLGGS